VQSDPDNHVYLSVGHQQMMTDPMKPLGISLWQLTAGRPMYTAGGRLFVDVTRALASPASRAGLLEVVGKGDPLMGDALQTIQTTAPALAKRLTHEQRDGVVWVKPLLVAQVEYRSWSPDGIVRHAVFKAFRQDKRPSEIRKPPSLA